MLRVRNVQIRGLLSLCLNGCSHPARSVTELLSARVETQPNSRPLPLPLLTVQGRGDEG